MTLRSSCARRGFSSIHNDFNNFRVHLEPTGKPPGTVEDIWKYRRHRLLHRDSKEAVSGTFNSAIE